MPNYVKFSLAETGQPLSGIQVDNIIANHFGMLDTALASNDSFFFNWYAHFAQDLAFGWTISRIVEERIATDSTEDVIEYWSCTTYNNRHMNYIRIAWALTLLFEIRCGYTSSTYSS